MHCQILSFAILLLTLATGPLHANDWPHWRGPLGNGVSLDATPPVDFSPTKNLLWKD